MRDLAWTGNQFLDRGAHAATVAEAFEGLDVTTKEDVWSEGVADAVAASFGVVPSFVRVGAGATQVIDAVLRTLYRSLLVDVVPNFHLASTVARQEGWNYEPVEVREPGELREALEPLLDRDAIFVLSSPRNPLGYQFPVDEVASLAASTAGTVVVDEVYADFAADSALRLVTSHPNIVVVRSFSKAWGLASLRVGFGVSAAFARPELSMRLLPNSVSGVAQRAAQRVLAEPQAVRRSIANARAARRQLVDELESVQGLRVWPSDANYVCVETPAAEAIHDSLQAAGYRVKLVHELRSYPASWPRGLRITVPCGDEIEVVVRHARQAQSRAHGAAGVITR